MAFNSLSFLLFYPIVVVAYYVLPGRARWMWLLAASLFAYGLVQPLLAGHLVAVAAVTWALGLRLGACTDKEARKRLLSAGVVLLVGNLAVFKYTAFANESLRSLFGWVGVPYPVPALEFLLPLGISFYTFQLISYLVDTYRGGGAERSFGLFLLYVAFFPKMVAGPIERAGHLLPQLRQVQRFDSAVMVGGLQLILWGAFKKVVVADRLAPFVQQVYDSPANHDGVVIVLATLLFAFQIYCDFSGYTDMALGVGQTFGYRLTNNFNRPYLATSIQDFWKRWHISLTSWLTDYVYTPLTRNRAIKIKWYYLMLASLFVTFVVSGLWHGAAWTFVAWGALHGTYLVTGALTQKWRLRLATRVGLTRRPALHRRLKIATTFSLVCFAYILFEARSLPDALTMIGTLPTGWAAPVTSVRLFLWDSTSEILIAFLGIAVVVLVDLMQPAGDVRELLALRRPVARWTLYYATLLAIVLLGAFYDANQRFIYFQF